MPADWSTGYVKMEQIRACANCGLAIVAVPHYDDKTKSTPVHLRGREQRTWDRDELQEESSCPRRDAA